MVYLDQVEMNQLIRYRFAALFDLPKRMLAVHISLCFQHLACVLRVFLYAYGEHDGGALFLF